MAYGRAWSASLGSGPMATTLHLEPQRRPVVARGHRLIALRAALLVVLVSALAAPGALPAIAVTSIAPACHYDDVTTRYHARSDYYRSLLDTKYQVTSAYAPIDLVPVSRAGVAGNGYLRRIVISDLTKMASAARAAGAPFAVQSAYRSYSQQVATFKMWVRQEGYRVALLGSARPGHSEHQLGTAMDARTPGGPAPWYYTDWGATKAGTWLRGNSWKYGWILSYPKGRSPVATCYKYEPWHFRYFGRTIAAKIHASALSAREWLWSKGATGTWTGGAASPTPTPRPTATPSPSGPPPSPSASASDSPSQGPSPTEAASPTDPASTQGPSPTVAPSDIAPPASAVASSDPTPDPTVAPQPG